MNLYFEKLKAHIKENLPNFEEGKSVLTMLFECYNKSNPYDNEQIRADFNERYLVVWWNQFPGIRKSCPWCNATVQCGVGERIAG